MSSRCRSWTGVERSGGTCVPFALDYPLVRSLTLLGQPDNQSDVTSFSRAFPLTHSRPHPPATGSRTCPCRGDPLHHASCGQCPAWKALLAMPNRYPSLSLPAASSLAERITPTQRLSFKRFPCSMAFDARLGQGSLKVFNTIVASSLLSRAKRAAVHPRAAGAYQPT